MASSGHAAALAAKHAELDAQIHTESQRPHPDETTLHQLKRAKLKIKDELSRLPH